MPRNEAHPDDPLELQGVGIREGSLEETARCLIEEYVRLGFTDKQLLGLFHNPFFAGPYAIYQAKGEAWIQETIRKVREQWGQPRFTVQRGSHEGPA
ncbi:MAG: hypothetical protein ACK4K2_04175 [Dehalococcoidia bacterium]